MSVGSVLEDIGKGVESGLKTTGRVAGAVLPKLGQGIANEEAGYAPQIAAEGRAHQQKMEDAALAAKEQEMTAQLEMGRKYGTLTPEQQQQYVDQITGLYSHPRHAGTLMEKLRQAVHPNGAIAGPAPKLASAIPPGGTAAADEQRAEQLAAAKYHARPQSEFNQYLEKYTADHGLPSVDAMTSAQYEDALHAYSSSKRAEKMSTKIVEDPDSPSHFSAATWDLTTGKLVSKFPGVLPPRGFIPTDRVSKSTDQYGNVTETVSQMTPEIPGMPGQQRQPVPTHPEPPKPTAGGPKKNVASVLGGVSGVKPVASAAPTSKGPRQLDATGHIPAGADNPQVVEAANQLIDGADKDKLPAKAREKAGALARQYGWEQGTFTPKEKVLLRESGTFLTEAEKNPALSVLDSPVSRAKLAQLVGDQQKKGGIRQLLTIGTTMGETPEEAEFVRMYNQLVGTISGLSQLTRSGRATEQTINRLVNELPNPLTTSSASDARARLKRLQQELTVAQSKGNFGDGGSSPAAALSGGSVNVNPEDIPQ